MLSKDFWTINNETVGTLDETVAKLMETTVLVIAATKKGTLTKYHVNELGSYIRKAEKNLKQVNSEKKPSELSVMEQLLVENARAVLRSIKAYNDYFHQSHGIIPYGKGKDEVSERKISARSRLRVPHLLGDLYGNSTNGHGEIIWSLEKMLGERIKRIRCPGPARNIYTLLAENCGKRMDGELAVRYDRLMAPYIIGRNNSWEDDAHVKLKGELPLLKRIILEFIRENSITKIGEEPDVVLSAVDESTNFFNPSLSKIGIDPDTIYVHGKEMEVYDKTAYIVALHEASHFLAHLNSRDLPRSLRSDDKTYIPFAIATIEEGRAMWIEQFAVPWLEKKKADYGLSRNDLKILGMLPQIGLQHMAHELFYNLVLFKESVTGDGRYDNEEAEKIAAAELAKASGLSAYFIDSHIFSPKGFHESTMYDINYPVGYHHVQRTMRMMKSALGASRYKQNRVLLNDLLFTGQWCPGIHDKFMMRVAIPLALGKQPIKSR